MKYDTTRGVRNKNPLNIRFNRANKWQGEMPHDDLGFCRFKSMQYGLRAAFAVLRSYNRIHKLFTVREIISRWAPPSENSTEIYIAWICHRTMLKPDDVVKWNENEALTLIQAMCVFESKYLVNLDELEAARKLL